MHQDAGRAQPRHHPVRKIAGTLGGAAGEQHQIAARQRILDGALERGLVVRHGAEPDRLAAGFGDGRRDDRTVAVIDFRRRQRIARRHQLVAGREHRDIRLAHHLDRRDAAGRQHADLARAQPRAPPQHDLAAGDVGARIGDELPRCRRPAQVDRRRDFVGQVGVCRPGLASSPTRSVCSTIATASAPRGMTPPVAMVVAEPGTTSMAGGMAADDHLRVEAQAYRRRVAGARRVGRAQRKAVHIGAVERRHVDRRRHIAGKHPGKRRRERDRLGRQRRQLDMARKARGGLLGRDHLEELLLPGGSADGGEQCWPA